METEARSTLQTQLDLAPQEFTAAQKYDPLYTDLNLSNTERSLNGSPGQRGMLDLWKNAISPAMDQANAASTESARSQDVGDLERFGGRAVAAIKAANPEQQALMGELNRQAMGDLSLGATLDPSLRREVQQSVRSGQSARGFGTGMNDATEEAFASGLRAEQLRGTRRQFAQGVAGMNAAQSVDPMMAIVGRPSQANPQLLNAGVGQGASGVPSFDPFNPYSQDYWNTVYNARAGAKIAGNNANAALWGQAIKTAGGLAGMAMA